MIENCRINRQELWIALQDLSKAYDRVNISLLRLALLRIKLPNSIINLLIDLFTERQNFVIRDTELCAPYTNKQGID